MIFTKNARKCINYMEKCNSFFFFFFFFLSGFSFTDTDYSQDSMGREKIIFYSTLSLPPADKHSDISLQVCMWDDYHVILVATLVFIRLLLDETYHLYKLLFDWLIGDAMFVCLFDDLILGFCYRNLIRETGGLKSCIINLVLQVNRLTKLANHSNILLIAKFL